MEILGVVPVAGKGSRWGGYFKELLPVGNGEWLLDRTIGAMMKGGANKICVITTPEKISTHIAHINSKYSGIFYVTQKEKKDIWGAMKESLIFAGELNLFAMPDTYFPSELFVRQFRKTTYGRKPQFFIGVHKTTMPERFGVLLENKVVNKQKLSDGTYDAWGTLVWTKEVAKFWIENPPETYTEAINSAMKEFEWETFAMEYYKDMATWKDYTEFIK